MTHLKLLLAALLITIAVVGNSLAQDTMKPHQLASISEKQLDISFKNSEWTISELAKLLPNMPIGEKVALIVRSLEQVANAEHSIMPGQTRTPRYEQIFVATLSRIGVIQKLQEMIQISGDDFTAPLAMASLNADLAWLRMILSNKLAPEDYLSRSERLRSELLSAMNTDANFKVAHTALGEVDRVKPRTLAYALFLLELRNTCAENSRLCDRALPE